MTVKELIAVLQTCDQDAAVMVDDSSFDPTFARAYLTEAGNVLITSYDYDPPRYREL
jgi:hypothetical protein